MDISQLVDAGLTKNEASVYVTLLKLGSASVEDISKNCKLHRRSIYDTIERLTIKGLVGKITKNNRKYFTAAHPNNLLNDLKQKQTSITKLLPKLIQLSDCCDDKPDVSVYDGVEGIKLIFDDILSTGEPNSAISTFVPKKFSSLTMNWHRRRIKANVKNRILFNYEENGRAKELTSMANTEVRLLPKEYNPRTSINVYGNKVGMIIWYDEDKPISIIIKMKSPHKVS